MDEIFTLSPVLLIMIFPKKITKSYPPDKEPLTIIKATGAGALLRIVEYRLIKRVGNNCMYKIDKVIK